MFGTIPWQAAEIVGGLPVTESQDQAVAGGGDFLSLISMKFLTGFPGSVINEGCKPHTS